MVAQELGYICIHCGDIIDFYAFPQNLQRYEQVQTFLGNAVPICYICQVNEMLSEMPVKEDSSAKD